MSGLPYTGGMNSYMFDTSQYGVTMPDTSQQALDAGGDIAKMMPYIGPVLGAMFNFWSQQYQNSKQEDFYARYMSPGSRMRQMVEAGINPNAAAQGISGASAPQMAAAAPTSAFSGLGEQLGNSVNTALTASAIKAAIAKTAAETDLTNSLNTEKQTTNRYLDALQQATLNKLVQDGRISKSFANMAAVDEAYKPANAEASYRQLLANLEKTSAEVSNLAANTIHELAGVYQAMAAASLSEAQIHKVFSDIGMNNAMIEKISHEVGEIDARTAATYQGINESKARTAVTNIAYKFQNDYYAIWQKTGFNWNSDIEKSIVGLYSCGDLSKGDDIMNSLGRYIQGSGNARVKSSDYQWNSDLEVAKMITGIFKIL